MNNERISVILRHVYPNDDHQNKDHQTSLKQRQKDKENRNFLEQAKVSSSLMTSIPLNTTTKNFFFEHEIAEQQVPIIQEKEIQTLSESDIELLMKQVTWGGHSFDIRQKLYHYLSQHENEFRLTADEMLSLSIYRQKVHDLCVKLLEQRFITANDLIKDPLKVMAFFESLIADSSIGVKLSVHYCLYGGMIAFLGSKQHMDEYFSNFETEKGFGCFLMSEIAHASNLKKLGTTAHYDRQRNAFIVHTNEQENQKFWIGNAYKSAFQGVLFAQLIDGDGVNRGLHPFVVPLRDFKTGDIVPGVKIKDCGAKMGLNGVDNASVYFDNLIIPAKNLLNRYAQIDSNGNYVTSIKNSNLLFAKHIGALLMARIGVGASGVSYSKACLFIAMRYAMSRKQFGDPSSDKELPIYYYRVHQKRLIPHLAATYCHMFFQTDVQKRYQKHTEKDLKKIHLLASISKTALSWQCIDTIQECREACGGQGYLLQNLISIMRVDADVLVTLDGDNHLLLQQISQFLLAKYRRKYSGKRSSKVRQLYNLMNEKIFEVTRNGLVKQYFNTDATHLRSPNFIVNALKYRYEKILHVLARRLVHYISNEKMKPFEAYNECQVHIVELAKAYSEYAIVKTVSKSLNQFRLAHAKTNPASVNILQLMYALYGLGRIEKNGGFFLQHQVISPKKFKSIRLEINEIVKEIVPNTLQLLDAFGIPEYIANNTIASSNKRYTKHFEFDNI